MPSPAQIAKNEALRLWRARNPDKQRAITRRQREHIKASPKLAARQREHNRRWAKQNRAWIRAYNKQYFIKLRKEFIAAYGSKCACCDETISEFLTLDHVNGGGNKHRRLIGTNNLYTTLKKVGWPQDEYRLLCMNCNWAGRGGKICPHKSTNGAT